MKLKDILKLSMCKGRKIYLKYEASYINIIEYDIGSFDYFEYIKNKMKTELIDGYGLSLVNFIDREVVDICITCERNVIIYLEEY